MGRLIAVGPSCWTALLAPPVIDFFGQPILKAKKNAAGKPAASI
jgi:hypothetical protein